MNREIAKGLLHDVHEILTELGLTHFLIDGTLLGAVREGDFIAHDLDVDMGVMTEEWTMDTAVRVVESAKERGIQLGHAFGELDLYFELSFNRHDHKIDLFFYRRHGALRIFHAFRDGARNLPDDVITYGYPAELIENLKPMLFLGESYPAPADPIAVLEAKYGPEWRTPITHWNWADDPKNKLTSDL